MRFLTNLILIYFDLKPQNKITNFQIFFLPGRNDKTGSRNRKISRFFSKNFYYIKILLKIFLFRIFYIRNVFFSEIFFFILTPVMPQCPFDYREIKMSLKFH